MKSRNFNEMPQHTSLTKDTFLYGKKTDGDFWDFCERKWFNRRKVYSYINRFWKKHIGDNYNDCRKKLIHNIKEKFGYDLVNVDLKPNTFPFLRYEDFFYDENGNIVENTERNKWTNHRTVKIDNRIVLCYTFDRCDFNDDEIKTLVKRLGKEKVERMFDETITIEEFKKIVDVICGSFFYPSLDIRRKAHPVIEGDVEEFGRRTPEYSQCMYEKRDNYKKLLREYKKEKALKNETLLHDIEENRKRKERLENSLKIQRYGFDEKTSFRGEEYHGKKRKNPKKGLK